MLSDIVSKDYVTLKVGAEDRQRERERERERERVCSP